MLGNRRKIKIEVLKNAIKEVDRIYAGREQEFINDYIKETITNCEDATDEQLDKILQCFINLRDEKSKEKDDSTHEHWPKKHME